MTLINLSWVTEQLAVGGSFCSELVPRLVREQGVRAVVDLRAEDRDDEAILQLHGLTLLHLPTEDHCAIDPSMLERGVAWVAGRVRAQERVYIHCEHGIGRSVLLAACVLVRFGDAPCEALLRIRRARAVASPSPVQLEALRAWCHEQRLASPPTWAELEVAAYRPLAALQPE